jgi:hypothetical protein
MKTPRTVKVLKLMTSVISSILHNEPLLLRGNLAQLDELGGIYIKFLQIVVLNLNPASQENFLQLLSVFERSKPDPIEVYSYLRSINMPHLERFASIDPKPIGTGSFGQVYQAQLHSGERVIIKLLRPSVMRYIHYDLRLLNVLSWFYSLADRQKILNFRDLYAEFRRTCLQEVNYTREAEAGTMFYERYKEHPTLVIPKTYREFCTPRVIVQDQIQGLSITDLLTYQAQGNDAHEYVRQNYNSNLLDQLYIIGYEIVTNALIGNIIQADPHPGNMILLSNGKIALIDFGMTTQLTSNRIAYYEMCVQYQAFYHDDIALEDLMVAALRFMSPKLYAAMNSAEAILGSGWNKETLLNKIRESTMLASMDESTQATVAGMIKEKRIMKLLFFAINKGNRFGLTLDLQAIMLQKATHSYLMMMAQFDKEGRTIARVLASSTEFGRQHMSKVVDLQPQEMQPHEAVEVLSTWFDKMARNDPWLMEKITGGQNK